jgi:AraC family transcriptional regulator
VSVTAKAIWYIESHLSTDLSLDAIAESAGVSRFHLSRAFAAATGMPISTYLRARRLSEAAKTLAAGAPDILAVALDVGYGSHEAFTRAFRDRFGLTPEQLRSQAHAQNITLEEPKRMNPTANSVLTPPRTEQAGELLIFGLSQPCKAVGDASIPALWNRFTPYIGNIEGQIGHVTYGVCYNSDDAGDYDYLCGVAVTRFPAGPADFTRLRIPPQTYAVFEHRDHISTIAGTFKAIWETGLSSAGLHAISAPLLERYDENFDGRTGLGGLEIWIPVKT